MIGAGVSIVAVLAVIIIIIRFGSGLNLAKSLDGIGDSFGSAIDDASRGFSDFLSGAGGSGQAGINTKPLDLSQPDEGKSNPANSPTHPTPIDIILNDPSKTQVEKQQEVLSTIAKNDKAGVNGFDRVFRADGSEKFNPEGVIGFGDSKINDGNGVPDTPTNRRLVNDVLSGVTFVGGAKFEGVDSENPQNTIIDFDNPFGVPFAIPQAFGEKLPPVQGPIRVPSAKELDSRSSLSKFADSAKGADDIASLDSVSSGNFKGEVDGVNIDSAFGGDFVIRPKAPDRTRLLTDSNNRPTETASQRADRVFRESGDFADKGRGATSIKKTKNDNFNFGTNSGSGQKGSTPKDTQKSRADALQEQAQIARQVFDSRSISNF